jgi:hypothetical protein
MSYYWCRKKIMRIDYTGVASWPEYLELQRNVCMEVQAQVAEGKRIAMIHAPFGQSMPEGNPVPFLMQAFDMLPDQKQIRVYMVVKNIVAQFFIGATVELLVQRGTNPLQVISYASSVRAALEKAREFVVGIS